MHVRIAHFVSRAKNKCFCGHIHIRYICTQCVREYYYSFPLFLRVALISDVTMRHAIVYSGG